MNETRIREAESSLRQMLGLESLTGRTFLDIGSGSGLFSLAALRLGAAQVHSFDYDVESVACTKEMKRRYAAGQVTWTLERGDVLDGDYMAGLGTWDIAYSWGVLHHTGDLWQALDDASRRVKAGGLLYVAIYNDQGARSIAWRAIKRFYQRGPLARVVTLVLFVPYFAARGLVGDLLRRRNPWQRYRTGPRGMSAAHDWVDWLGGYPFEVATPERVVDACAELGLRLARLRTVGGRNGCNEFVFSREVTLRPA